MKSSTDKDRKVKQHIQNASFQRIVVQKAVLKVVNVYLLELNKEFYKNGDIDPIQLFNTREITSQCIELKEQILQDIIDSKELLGESVDRSCKYNVRSRHCRAFDYIYPNVLEYSIYDLRAIVKSVKVLRSLVDANHLNIEEVPESFVLGSKHALQSHVTLTSEVVFEREKIQAQFDDLVYPLYFLDNETLACRIPKLENTYPYQQTVFQYSLHIVHKSFEIEHKEFRHRDQSTPVHLVAEKLREDIGDEGSVIVWNKGFEGKCKQDLSVVNPALAPFLFRAL